MLMTRHRLSSATLARLHAEAPGWLLTEANGDCPDEIRFCAERKLADGTMLMVCADTMTELVAELLRANRDG